MGRKIDSELRAQIVGPALIVGVDGEEFTNIQKGLARQIWLKYA